MVESPVLALGITAILAVANLISASLGNRTRVAAVLLACWMWILVWSTTNKPDFDNYRRMYDEHYRPSGVGEGYWFLTDIAHAISLDYLAFVALISAISYTLIFTTIRSFVADTDYVYVAYLVFPFVLDAVQTRNLLSYALVIFGFRFLIKATRRGRLEYVICVLLAASIHVASLVYLALLIVHLDRRLKNGIVVGSVLVGFALAIAFPGLIEAAAESLTDMASSERLGAYLSSRGQWGFLLLGGLQLYGLFLSKKFARLIAGQSKIGTERQSAFVVLVYQAIFVLSFLLPLYMLNSNFWRLYRNMLILIYASAATTRATIPRETWQRNHGTLYLVLYVVLLGITRLIPIWDSIVLPIMGSNYFT